MKVDIIIPVYYTYNLLLRQIQFWSKIKGDWRLLICDNTPARDRQPITVNPAAKEKIRVFTRDNEGIDGEKHGDVLNYMVKQTETEIICIQDCDFFWLDEGLLEYISRFFKAGFQCVGTEIFYEAFQAVDDLYPERHSSLAPCIFGMFIKRELALQADFICSREEGKEKKETGWKLRKYLIENKIKTHLLPCIKHESQIKNKELITPWLYVGNHKYIGIHLFGSTSYNNEKCEAQLDAILREIGK